MNKDHPPPVPVRAKPPGLGSVICYVPVAKAAIECQKGMASLFDFLGPILIAFVRTDAEISFAAAFFIRICGSVPRLPEK